MSEAIFNWATAWVMPFWLLLLVAPRARLTRWVMDRWWGPVGPVLLYAALALPRLDAVVPALTRPDLAGLATLLATPAGAALAWCHLLAFDLLVAGWIVRDAEAVGVRGLVLAPVLLLTLFLGPLGWAVYLGVRGRWLREQLTALVARAQSGSRLLTSLSGGHAALLGVLLLALGADGRLVTGAPVWLKPAKFAASIALYGLTLAWALSFVEGRPRAARRIAWASAAGLALEMAIIGGQAARGVPSHFNVSTALDAALFTAMGVGILVVWVAGLAAAWLLFRQRFEDRSFGLALRWGLLLSLGGALMGGLMTRPTSAQLEAMRSGPPSTSGAHSVGVPDGGPGLPLIGWSSTGGDLRVAHFAGLHAFQLLPLAAFLLARSRLGRWLSEAHRRALVAIWTGVYAGAFGVLIAQALQGEPLLAPRSLTVALAAALLAAAGVSTAAVLIHGLRLRAPRVFRSSHWRSS